MAAAHPDASGGAESWEPFYGDREVKMSGGTLRTLLSIVIIAHGAGHFLLLAPCVGLAEWGQAAHSWLLTSLAGEVTTRVVGGFLWVAVIGGFSAAGAGLLGQRSWWRAAAVSAAVVSLLALVIFASGTETQPLLSAAAMDVAVLVALLWIHWPTAALIGA